LERLRGERWKNGERHDGDLERRGRERGRLDENDQFHSIGENMTE
jgi:hypothetical protein